MPAANLDKLFHDGLRDALYAEKKGLQALKKQARAVKSPELKQAFETHRDETEGQIERLQQVFETIGKRASGKTCAALDGLAEEGQEILEEYKDSPALDAGLLGAAQAIEHYEIARYGTLSAWARQLDLTEVADLVEESLEEESDTDELLSEMAEAAINPEAV